MLLKLKKTFRSFVHKTILKAVYSKIVWTMNMHNSDRFRILHRGVEDLSTHHLSDETSPNTRNCRKIKNNLKLSIKALDNVSEAFYVTIK